jgi:hypothetical protein
MPGGPACRDPLIGPCPPYAQSTCFFFSQEGQKLRLRQEKATPVRSFGTGRTRAGEAVLEQAAAQELPQHTLDHRPQRAVTPGKALRSDPQQLLGWRSTSR